MIWRALYLSLTCFVIFACSKPAAPPTPESTPNAEIPTPTDSPEIGPVETVPPPVLDESESSPMEQPLPDAVAGPTPTAESLRQRFFDTQNATERSNIVQNLGQLNNAEAIAVLGLLFQNERTEELKLDILLTLENMQVENTPKISVLSAAVRPDQPQAVREAAIDILAELDEPGALPMLQSLTTDADPEIRDVAKDALEDALEDAAAKAEWLPQQEVPPQPETPPEPEAPPQPEATPY